MLRSELKEELGMKSEKIKQEPQHSSDEDNRENQSNSDNEAELNWWEQENLYIAGKGEKRWDTLSHNGVLFAPAYIPHGIPLIYDGVEFQMTPEEEEVATMFAVLKEHEYYQNEMFRRNFFRSWREILDQRGEHPIKRLELCDFEPIYQWSVRQKEKKLAMTKEEKKELKRAAAAEAEPYKYCIWDGRREEVTKYRVEPPGLFRGRGKHPLVGTLKKRVEAEDITINIGEEATVPMPPLGHKWAAVQHDHTVTWLAMWRDNVTGNNKYVMPAATSTIKGQSDMMKFEKSRKLKEHIERIRASYTNDFKSTDAHVAQRAVAMYFIDKLALRVGNEKGSDEADTVGCCSLRVEHIQLLPNFTVRFDFIGKDSIRYQNEVVVLPEVYALLIRLMRGKKPHKDIFDQLTPTQLNEHLKSFMDGLSAKVFRTYNASVTLDRWFKEKPVDESASVHDKLTYFNKANTEVAILCNHQKSVSKNVANQLMQLGTKAKYTRAIIDELERAKANMQTRSVEEAIEEFFMYQDRVQLDWLERYGTEEQKQEYEDMVAKRDIFKLSQKMQNSDGQSQKQHRGKIHDHHHYHHQHQHRRRHSQDEEKEHDNDANDKKTRVVRGKRNAARQGGKRQRTSNQSKSSKNKKSSVCSLTLARNKRKRSEHNDNDDDVGNGKLVCDIESEEETIASLMSKNAKNATHSRSRNAAGTRSTSANKRTQGKQRVKKEVSVDNDVDDDDIPIALL